MFDTRISILGGVLDTGIPQKERQHGPLGLVEWSVIGPFVRSTWGGGGGGRGRRLARSRRPGVIVVIVYWPGMVTVVDVLWVY